MLKKINISDLQEGMYIANPSESWLSNPFLYIQEGFVVGSAEVKKAINDGYVEVFIDLQKSRPGSLPEEWRPRESDNGADSTVAGLAAESKWEGTAPVVPIGEELAEAERICSNTMSFVRSVFASGEVGAEQVDSATPLVDEMLNSLQRNSNALLGLSKLRMTDNYTYTHCVNVAVFTLSFAAGLGVPREQLQAYGLAGLFHDFGKSLVPNDILNAPRKLNDDEMIVMKKHSSFGYDMLSKINNVPAEVVNGAHQHHEKYNGLGYPLGLSGDSISLVGRIISVIDIYDALTSKRVYKPAMPAVKVLGIMYGMREHDFAPGFVENFIRMLGVYPVGSVVELSNNCIGVVSSINNSSGTKPQVALVKDQRGKRYSSPVAVDLEAYPNVSINKCLEPGQYDFDVEAVLKAVNDLPAF